MNRVLAPSILLAVAACSGSGSTHPITCTNELRSTIMVNVTDARTGSAAALGSTVIVKGAGVYDSVVVASTPFNPATAYVGWEDRVKAGRYSVEVRKPGYVSFLRTDVDVTSDQCHSGPGPSVQAALQPAS